MAVVSDEESSVERDTTHARDEPEPAAVPRRGGVRARLMALLFGIASVLLALDVVTKSLAVAHLDDGPPVKLFGGALYLVLFRNPGAAFNIADGLTWLLALLAIVVVAAIIWFAPRLRSRGWAVGIGLVLGGACGNLVDRIFREPAPLRGHVIDFLSVFAPDGSVWPVFNLADSGIVCGGILVVLLSLLGYDYDGTVHRRRGRDDGAARNEQAAESGTTRERHRQQHDEDGDDT